LLIQSHEGEIHLLQALPDDWENGSFSGLKARGGFVVDVSWKDGKLELATITSSAGGPCKLRYGSRVTTLSIDSGTKGQLSYRISDGDVGENSMKRIEAGSRSTRTAMRTVNE